MRILVAALLGAIAMFAWSAVAHMATPLAFIGFQQLPREQQVIAGLKASNIQKPGLFILPWVDPKDPRMMQKTSDLMKTEGAGLVIYAPPHMGGDPTAMGPMMVVEFLKQFVETLIAAYLVSLMAGVSFAQRLGAVTLIGVVAGLVTNVSYWNWYRFPTDYTLAQIAIEVIGAFVAGVAIAWWMGRGRAASV